MSENQSTAGAISRKGETSEHQQRVLDVLDGLGAEAAESEKIGRLTDETARLLRQSQALRLLGNTDFGGFEAHPVEFIQAAHKIGAVAPSAAWVTGVVGVHAFEFGQCSPELQADIWGPNGENPDVWTASPYAPQGVGKRVDGGYLLSGHWTFSTGCDHSDWFIFGGFVADENGEKLDPPVTKHFVLPTSDGEILQDSWQVMGLGGTGSKDVVLKVVFIPEYRAIDAAKMASGEYARQYVPEKNYYRHAWRRGPAGRGLGRGRQRGRPGHQARLLCGVRGVPALRRQRGTPGQPAPAVLARSLRRHGPRLQRGRDGLSGRRPRCGGAPARQLSPGLMNRPAV